MTVGQWKREVEKYEKKLRDMVRSVLFVVCYCINSHFFQAMEASRTLDVDTFIITAGNIVLHNRGLVSFFETPNAVGVSTWNAP